MKPSRINITIAMNLFSELPKTKKIVFIIFASLLLIGATYSFVLKNIGSKKYVEEDFRVLKNDNDYLISQMIRANIVQLSDVQGYAAIMGDRYSIQKDMASFSDIESNKPIELSNKSAYRIYGSGTVKCLNELNIKLDDRFNGFKNLLESRVIPEYKFREILRGNNEFAQEYRSCLKEAIRTLNNNDQSEFFKNIGM